MEAAEEVSIPAHRLISDLHPPEMSAMEKWSLFISDIVFREFFDDLIYFQIIEELLPDFFPDGSRMQGCPH